MGHFTAAETQRDLGLVTILEKADQITQLDAVITNVRSRAEFDFLDLDLLLLLFRRMTALALLVLELAEIHDPAYGW